MLRALLLMASWLFVLEARAEPDAGLAASTGSAQEVARLEPTTIRPTDVARAFAAQENNEGADKADSAPGASSVREAYERVLAAGVIKLERKSDRSYVYKGRGFNARIDGQGGFVMSDRFSRSTFSFTPVEPTADNLNWFTSMFKVMFDLFSKIDKAFGNDPYRSERHQFLRETQELRIALLARQGAAALSRLMNGIWGKSGVSIAEKKKQLFQIWAACTDDEFGETARRSVEAFMVGRCPLESACAFGRDGLEKLNRDAPKGRTFEPYRAR